MRGPVRSQNLLQQQAAGEIVLNNECLHGSFSFQWLMVSISKCFVHFAAQLIERRFQDIHSGIDRTQIAGLARLTG
jgi:hypothetical protein